MEVRKIDNHIKKAFTDLGFTDKEVQDGCWLLERKNKPVAWIALHKFLERVAIKAGIYFDKPEVLCSEKDFYQSTKWVDGEKTAYDKETRNIALYVNGVLPQVKDNIPTETTAWAIGEASGNNCLNDYPWAMAEKRAKDRVILKLLGVAGDMYSEEEADDFKNKPEVKEETPKITPHTPEAIEDTLSISERQLNECHTIEQLEKCKEGLREIAKKWKKHNQLEALEKLTSLIADKDEQLKGE